MANIRFNHVFTALLALSILSAFVLPERKTDSLRPHLQGVFTWVSKPLLRASGAVAERLTAGKVEDPRSVTSIRNENDALRVALINLQEQLQTLNRLNAERDRVGLARDMTIPVSVTGADSGGRDSLSLSGTSGEGLKRDQPVLYPGGVAGRIDRAGVSGSQVRLITDYDFRFLVSFGRYQQNGDQLEFYRLPLQPLIIKGVGSGAMVVQNLTAKAVQDAGLKVGDWATLADGDWPMSVQGYRIGRVTEIRPAKAALFADVKVEPDTNLMGLREVMVMTK